ncbi:MAG: hypothetical protein A3I68_00640 [Candidatus Melainabacteria bacterium RIFCSPLOWO2_02_FULL_35_15]|nr:MAG: hypothetical protein A3I68_00640 [Candidatus Melainabacteria bacterium RIFCSPLOWO2_02_FULL_35_15]
MNEKEKKVKKQLINLLILILSLFLMWGCFSPPRSEEVYKIAVVAPQSGPYLYLGESIINGAELAVEEANASGGIDRKKIVLIKEDDGGLVGEGAFFAYRLTRTEMVLGVIGHLNSDISIPASEFYARAMIPEISPGSTSPYFTERIATMGYVFRTIGRDDTQGKLLADYVIKHGLIRVAILYNDRAYGKLLAGEFAKSLKNTVNSRIKPQIVFYNMIEVGKKDYGALISQLSSYKPDVVFLAGEQDDAGNLVKDFPRYGLGMTRFIGGDGIDNEEFIKIGGKNTEGAVVISPSPITDKSFIDKYVDRFKKVPLGYAANSYDATNILIAAIRKVKVQDGEKIAREVASTMNFKGVSGLISFNENGDLTSPGFVLSKVENGKFKVIANEK